jgi:sodium-dependent dicarboxylate transporter 2/3/5
MAGFWMTEAVPLPVTALMPIMLFPPFGIMSTSVTSLAYMKETNMMSIAGLMIANAIEHCNLHKRIALKALLTIGTSPRL